MAKNTVDDFLIDFSKEEESGGGARYKEGVYLFRITGAKTGSSESKGTPFLQLNLQFKEGKYKGKKLQERLYVTPKAYSRFRTLLEAVGIKQPAKLNLLKLIPKLKDQEFYGELVDDDSRDTIRSTLAFQGFINPDDYEPDVDEDDEEDEDEELEDEELEDEDEEEEEEAPAPKRRKQAAGKKATSKSRSKDAEEDEEDDEEEEEAPRKRSKSKASTKKSSTKKRAADEDEDDEDEDLEDLDLDSM